MSELIHHPARPFSPASDGSGLKSYTAAKHSLAAVIRQLQEFLTHRGNQSRVDQCHDLMVKLAEDRFTLAVVGQFNRGKSSLMNAILGDELLPVGILPLTSVITILRYGPRERLLIRREGFAFDSDAPLSALPDYVTEEGNPGNEKKIRAVYIEIPSPFLQRGLEFVDTPGIGSSIEANTRTTLDFLPQCDAVLFVTSVDTPLTEAERDFLKTIRQHVRKIFFLVNKIDLLHGSRQEEALAFISKTLSEQMPGGPVKIFLVSARLAMRNSFETNANFHEHSGIARLKAELIEFLRTQKAETFLAAMLDKAKRVFEAESQSLEVELQMASLPQNERVARMAEMNQQYESVMTQSKEALAAESALATDSFLKSFESSLADFLGAEQQELNNDLHRATLFWPGQSRTGATIDEFTRQICEKLKRDVEQWSRAQIGSLNVRLHEILNHAYARARANAQSLTSMIAKVLDVKSAPAVFGAALPDIALSVPELPSFSWKAAAPALRRRVPLLFSRRWVRHHLETGLAGLLADMRVVLLTTFRADVQKAFVELSEFVAAQLERSRNEYSGHTPQLQKTESAAVESTSLHSQSAERDRLRQRFHALHPEIAGAMEPNHNVSDEIAEARLPIAAMEPAPDKSALADRSLYQDIKTRGCPVCTHVRDVLFNFYAQWQYTLASDENCQEQFAGALGFCPLHTWQLATISSPDGISLGFPRLAQRVAEDLRKHVLPLPASGGCRACDLVAHSEAAYGLRLLAALGDMSFRDAYASSQGVCLRHLKLLSGSAASDELRRFLSSEAARHFEQLAEDMRNYAIKRDATRRQLANADENDAYQRTVIHLVGERYLCVSSNPDSSI